MIDITNKVLTICMLWLTGLDAHSPSKLSFRTKNIACLTLKIVILSRIWFYRQVWRLHEQSATMRFLISLCMTLQLLNNGEFYNLWPIICDLKMTHWLDVWWKVNITDWNLFVFNSWKDRWTNIRYKLIILLLGVCFFMN